jgi:hypothetical protein
MAVIEGHLAGALPLVLNSKGCLAAFCHLIQVKF